MSRVESQVKSPVATLLVLCATASAALAQGESPAKPGSEPPSLGPIGDALRGVYDRIAAPRAVYKNGPQTREAFRPVIADARKATVSIRKEGRRVALGGVVGPDGWIVTKASLIEEPVTVRLADGRRLPARVVGIDSPTDLAMLKVEASGLPTLDLEIEPGVAPGPQFVALKTDADDRADGASQDGEGDSDNGTTDPNPEDVTAAKPASDTPALESSVAARAWLMPGDWLATVGQSRDPLALGVVSVLPRPIEKRPGFLGVQLDQTQMVDDGDGGVRIDGVTDGGAAGEAGLLEGDIIVSIDGRPTVDNDALRSAIGDRNPGDRVEVLVQRGDQPLRFVAVLHGWEPSPAERRAYYQNNLGGKLSERRFGFPSALQHDSVLSPRDCGGPIVDLEGRVVGFNISRAGRTESYALPVSVVSERLLDLMSGRLAPLRGGEDG